MKSYTTIRTSLHLSIASRSYLGFSRFSLMAGYANLIEETMELTNDGGNLGGKVAGVHDSGLVKAQHQYEKIFRVVVLCHAVEFRG